MRGVGWIAKTSNSVIAIYHNTAPQVSGRKSTLLEGVKEKNVYHHTITFC